MKNKQKILIISLGIIVIVAISAWYLYGNYINQEINYVQSGNLVKNSQGMKPNTWYLVVYEEPGKPVLNAELQFDKNSVCEVLGETKPCGNSLNIGDRVGVQGFSANGVVHVKILKVNIIEPRK